MSWNVRSLRDDRDVLVRVVREIGPDVLFVQEAPRFLRSRSHLAALARDTGLVFACGGRAAAGLALLTSLRVDVLDTLELTFPKARGLHRRGLAAAVLRLNGVHLAAGSVHLGLDADERARHAVLVRQALTGLGQPLEVVAGDVNETDDGTAWRALASGLADVARDTGKATPTFPAVRPKRRIDVILISPCLNASPVTVQSDDLARATDHLPVVVDVDAP